jgi:hypothetical protein
MLFHGSKKTHFRLPCFLLFTSFCIFVGVLERKNVNEKSKTIIKL